MWIRRLSAIPLRVFPAAALVVTFSATEIHAQRFGGPRFKRSAGVRSRSVHCGRFSRGFIGGKRRFVPNRIPEPIRAQVRRQYQPYSTGYRPNPFVNSLSRRLPAARFRSPRFFGFGVSGFGVPLWDFRDAARAPAAVLPANQRGRVTGRFTIRARSGSGWDLLASGKLPEARQAFSEQAERYSGQPLPFVGLALVAAAERDWESAAARINRAQRVDAELVENVVLDDKLQPLLGRILSDLRKAPETSRPDGLLTQLKSMLDGDVPAAGNDAPRRGPTTGYVEFGSPETGSDSTTSVTARKPARKRGSEQIRILPAR